MGKIAGGGSKWTYPLDATVDPKVVNVSFDLYIAHNSTDDIYYSNKNVLFRIYLNDTYKYSPYSGSIHTYNGGTTDDITDDYFTIGDASSSAGGTAYYKQNLALGEQLSFNTWYNVEMLVHLGDGTAADFYVCWYVNGEFYGYSTNFYNESGTIDASTPGSDATFTQMNSVYIYALKDALFNASFDNLTVSAYDDALKVEPDITKTWDFEDAENLDVSLDTGDTTNNTTAAATIDEHNAVLMSTQTTAKNAKWQYSIGSTVDAKIFEMEFDFYLCSENRTKGFLAYIFLNSAYDTAPYGSMLYADSDEGFTIGDRASTSATATKALGGYISYDEWHKIKLVVNTGSGNASDFIASWYVDGELYATSTTYWSPSGSTTTQTSVNSLYLFAQGSAKFNAYLDNLKINVYKVS